MIGKLPKLPVGAQWLIEGELYGIVWANRRTTPRWPDTGPALAYAQALWKGTRRPEYETMRHGPVWGARSLPERDRP